MNSTEGKSHGNQPPTGPNGHPLPRRASPSKSVTLRHHALARDASNRNKPSSTLRKETTIPSISRGNSSNESHETGPSDAKNWFDQSNENPTANFDNSIMDVDPPFFQKESESSNEDKSFAYNHQLTPAKLTAAPQSSSAGDYRSVIDDLTIEIQSLKEELKRYKQTGPDMLRKEKLFEIKVHGLPNKKKRELEATLRDFAAGLENSPDASSSQRNKKSSRHTNRDRMYSASGSMSKHASSTSGSNFPPADSAYASMSVGAKSSGPPPARPMKGSKDANQKKVQSYLNDIPEGLYPKHLIMSERERKKLVVRRLEQLFTGKIGGRHAQKKQAPIVEGKSVEASVAVDAQPRVLTTLHEPPSLTLPELAREAKISLSEQQSRNSGKTSQSRDYGSVSNSHGDQTEPGGNGNSTGSGGPIPSPPSRPSAPEQRPTRPRDLDPDRTQIPSENMDYIRHLGLTPPQLLPEQQWASENVHPDADGWVYLNLLCSLAQLHIINVTPDFVRVAVTEFSSKFQLSSDGRKIRWRGGLQGTKFSSDSSGYSSQQSPSPNDSDDSKAESRKRQKTSRSVGAELQPGSSNKKVSTFGAQILASSESFHYKPILVRRDSSNGRTSMDETLSSFGPPEDSNVDESRWGYSGSTSNQKKRRHDGAIIYYSGAPFCTDLSGDPGDASPPSNMLAASQITQDVQQHTRFEHFPRRMASSGSSINYRSLSDRTPFQRSSPEMDIDVAEGAPSLTTNDTENLSDVDMDLVWSDENQYIELHPLEPCGLGGVLPDDHFVVVVTTKRSKEEILPPNPSHQKPESGATADSIIRRLATMSALSPGLHPSRTLPESQSQPIKIEYVSGGIKRLAPVSLPPPAMFLPPFSADDSTTDMGGSEDNDSDSSDEMVSQLVNPHRPNDYPDGVDLSSGDEDGEDPDDSPGEHNMYAVTGDVRAHVLPTRSRTSLRRGSSSVAAAVGTAREGSKSTSAERTIPTDGTSAVMAEETKSGYSSSEEESS